MPGRTLNERITIACSTLTRLYKALCASPAGSERAARIARLYIKQADRVLELKRQRNEERHEG